MQILDLPYHFDGHITKFSVSYVLHYKIVGLAQQRLDKSQEAIMSLTSTGFTPSNTHDEPLIYPWHDSNDKTNVIKHHDRKIGLTTKVNANRHDVLMHRLWDAARDCILM